MKSPDNGGNGDTPPGEYGGATPLETEVGRLHMQLMTTQRDQAIQLAAERACADQVGRRLGAVELELARLGRHVAECSADLRDLRRDLKLFFDPKESDDE